MGSKRLKGSPSWDDFEAQVEQREDLKDKIADLNDTLKDINTDLLIGLTDRGVSTHTFVRNGRRYKVTKVQGKSLVIDEKKLRKRVGAAMWNRITTRTLDRKKLDAYVASGEVNTTVLAECSHEVDKTPYVKVT